MRKIGRNEPCICGSNKKYKRCCGANVSNNNNQYKPMHRQEIWRLLYRKRRYLEHLNKEDLAQRGKDILSNLTLLTDELQIGFQPVDRGGSYWMEIFTHLLEECSLRDISLNDILSKDEKDNPFPNYEIGGLAESVKEFSRLNLETGKYLVKYGKHQYLEPMLKKGSIRIMPASSYSDSSLNSAIRDNELETSLLTLPNEIKYEEFYKNIEVSVGDKKGKLEDFFEIEGNWTYTRVSHTDFYVYCLAYEHSYRMFGDFDADCCLVITNPTEFLRRVLEKFNEAIPNCSSYNQQVKYYDPLNVEKTNLPFYFSKHFGYAYQKEYRIIWIPPEKTNELKPIFLELGNLEDCCELITLKPN
jgi:hypothetical protein